MAGRRSKLASLVLVIALLFGSTTAQAQSTGVNVIVHLTPLATINQVLRTLIGGTVLDSIPGADIYLVNVPNLPLVRSEERRVGKEGRSRWVAVRLSKQR